MMKLLELGMFGWKNLERSWIFRLEAAWSRVKHVLQRASFAGQVETLRTDGRHTTAT
jgi:hypothetical protein